MYIWYKEWSNKVTEKGKIQEEFVSDLIEIIKGNPIYKSEIQKKYNKKI